MNRLLLRLPSRLALFALLWVILSAANWKSPAFALLTIVAASGTSLFLWPATKRDIRWSRIPALAVYFVRGSFVGGLDVARRAFSPGMPLQPEFISYETTLANEAGQVLFTWMIGLMPGTVCVDWENDRHLTVHVIDRSMYNRNDLRELESRIGAVLGAEEA